MYSLGEGTFSLPSFSFALMWTTLPTDEGVLPVPVAACLGLSPCIVLREWAPKQLSDQGGVTTVQVLSQVT